MPIPIPAPVRSSTGRVPTFRNAYTTFTLARFSLGSAEFDFNRAIDGFEEGSRRRLNRAFDDLQRAAAVVQAMRPDEDPEQMKRETAILYAALLRYESPEEVRRQLSMD